VLLSRKEHESGNREINQLSAFSELFGMTNKTKHFALCKLCRRIHGRCKLPGQEVLL